MLETISTPGSNTPWVQNWSYSFNAIGTLTQRKDLKRGLTEDFHYDNLNRLTQTDKNNSFVNSVTYDEIGNILNKSDVGDYTYGTTSGPHAVQSITTTSGTILSTGTQNIINTSFDKVQQIWQGVDKMVFTYGPGHDRKQVDTYQNQTLKSQKYYVGSLYEREKDIATGEIKETHYIFAAGGAVAIFTRSSTGATSTHYLHKDHLGSMQCITDETGNLLQELSYDAWGNRRDTTWNVYTTLPVGILLARGFTGHEHIDLFDLINMDGRVYDPVIGRFLSPDPVIQDPENLQSLNRYTYCLNNPLSLTDPSGYSWLSDNWRSLVAAAVAITTSAITLGTSVYIGYAIMAGAAGGFAGGVTGALLSGANIGQTFTAGIVGGLIGAASGALNFASSYTAFAKGSTGELLERAAQHGISNAMINGLTGGDIKHGFITGAFSSLGNAEINDKISGLIPKVASAAALGGTIDVIGGGKFANGAITGAYGMMFNEMMHPKPISTIIGKYANAMFPGRVPTNVNMVWQLTDSDEGLTDPIDFNTKNKLTVSIPEKLWNSMDKTLLNDCIDHELVHVGDYASGRTAQYIKNYGPAQSLIIMEYKAYSENLYYHTQMNTTIQYNQKYINYYQGLVKNYGDQLRNGWWNIK